MLFQASSWQCLELDTHHAAQLPLPYMLHTRSVYGKKLQQKLYRTHQMHAKSVNLQGRIEAPLLQGCQERFPPSSPGWGWEPLQD